MFNRIVDNTELPNGLKNLSLIELEKLCDELREELIETVSKCGGHFASSLGATEITVGLHYSFDTPNDKIIFDTGHQGYIHKMLTGRRDLMSTIRQKEGLCGLLKRSESQYDCFGAGHAGTSISAAVGMRVALDLVDPSKYVVAVIGDGSMTAGMALEALNHAGDLSLKKLIVVLNDNEMSISENVGAMSWLFSKAVTSQTSSTARKHFKALHRQGYVPDLVYKALDRAEEATQGFLSSAAMLFEGFGFRYIGPVDGNNVSEFIEALERAKRQDGPVLIHAYTKKGKGYLPAEEDPVSWHGVTPFNRELGEFISGSAKKAPTYTAVFSEVVNKLCREDPKIVAISAAMLSGTGLDKVKEAHPSQVFDVGICEQHAVTFAAGLACEGITPIVAIYSTFLQRGFDQVLHDVCIQNLPVVFAIDRGGVVGNDGETHQGVFDIAFLRTIPNMTIMSPKDEVELNLMLRLAVKLQSPVAVRYPRGNATGRSLENAPEVIEIGKSELLVSGSDLLIIAFGPVVQNALLAANTLKELGISCTLINARFAKPLDHKMLLEQATKHRAVFTIEDHALIGGFGSAVLELFSDNQVLVPVRRFGVADHFVAHASQAQQIAEEGFDPQSIVKGAVELLKEL